MGWINFLISMTKTYWGGMTYLALFAAACLAILVLEKEKIRKYTVLWYSAIVLVFIYNPVTYLAVKIIVSDEETYWAYFLRLFSLLPVFIIIGYGITLIISHLAGWNKFFITMACMVVLIILGDCVFDLDWYTKAENPEKVPQDVYELQSVFTDQFAAGEKVSIMAPMELCEYMRQVEAGFSMPYSRNVPTVEDQLDKDNPIPELVLGYACENDVEYVVVAKRDAAIADYEEAGFVVYGQTDNYVVLTHVDATWILTEYADDSGNQAMFYTMENVADGQLIVIDGGDLANEAKVRQVIKAKGGVVDAWIITHYHQDHVDAFNAIYADPQGIEIKEIYATPLDAETFESVAQEWDNPESFDLFMDQMQGAENLNYVTRGQVLDFDNDLKITFYNAFDEIVAAMDDIPNNDSLVFKMETSEQSILICADAHSEVMAEYLVETYGQELRANILQCGHHGNNSMPTETGFYEIVAPKIALFDSPEWLMTSDDYTAKALAKYLSDEDVEVVSYTTAPNYFAFY